MTQHQLAWRSIIRRFLASVLVVLGLLLPWPRALYAGTVTIIDGTGANTGPNVFDDAFIQSQLAAGHITIDTANATGSGPDEIRLQSGAVIIWTSSFSLTLRAQQHIVISGTIQHEGPGNGNGGVALLAGGDVVLGQGTQPVSVTVGSRHGLTRVDATHVRLQGGDASARDRSVLLGFRAINQGDTCGFSFESEQALWHDDGDCGYLFDETDTLVSEYCYD